MNVDIASVVAAMVHEAGGSVVINSETMNKDFSDQMLAIDYNGEKDIFVLTLVRAEDVEFGEEDAE